MYCKNCDQSFSDEQVFCTNCGNELEDIDAATEEQLETTTPDATLEGTKDTTEPTAGPEAEEIVLEATEEPVLQADKVVHSSNAAQSAQPVAFTTEDKVDKKQSKTVSVWTWIFIIILNIVPFSVGVIYLITSIVMPFFNLDNITVGGLILPALSLIFTILLFVWAFGKPKARSLKNYSIATLIIGGIIVVIAFILFLVLREYILLIIEQIGSMSGEFK